MLEKIWSEAQTVEVPKDLSPERMKERVRAQAREDGMKKKSEKQNSGRQGFRWHGFGGRAAAAAVVLALSLGAYGVANSQSAYAPGERQADGSVDASKDPAGLAENEANNAGSGDGAAEGTAETFEPQEPETVVARLGDYRLAESYEEVYDMFARMKERYYEFATKGAGDVDGAVLENSVAAGDGASADRDQSVMNDAADARKEAESFSGEKTPEFSTTNLQVSGVDESDIVKTDGKNIYIAADDQVRIVDVTTGVPRQLGSIRPELSGNMDGIREMYVADDRLVLIVQTEDVSEIEAEEGEAAKKMEADMIYGCGWGYDYSRLHTQILTYDITVPAGAKLVGTYEQDGVYNTSRKIGSKLYLFTDYGCQTIMPYARAEEQKTAEGEREVRLPQIQGQTVPENCIYLPQEGVTSGVYISAMDVERPEEAIDQKLIFNGGGSFYVTAKSIYLYQADYSGAMGRTRTKLTKFQIGDGKVAADCAEAVPGFVEDTFAIHESTDGYLYVLTTDYGVEATTNQLYVLDDKLKIYGKIEHIAEGETVYAARFVDDIGYFVTYRNMDPLFTVDFSDPKNPTLIGELEIPGFSDYLQFWDDRHLIGVGEERKEEDSEFVGIKLSLYDISDPTDVKETSKVVFDDAYGSPATYNYKSLLADRGKNVIAFLTEDKGGEYRITQQIYQVKDGKLVERAKDQIPKEWDYSIIADGFRNLYIGDKLYLAAKNLVIVYDMEDGFERTELLKLN